MVDKKIIIETITELMDVNVDKETIFSTLRDIGVDEGDIESNYNEILNSKKKTSTPEVKIEKEENTQSTVTEKIINNPKTNTQSTVTEKIIDNPKANKPNYVNLDDISNPVSSNKHEEELKDTTLEVNDINNKHEVDITKEEFTKSETQAGSSEPISSFDTSDDTKIIEKQISELETKIDDIKAELTGLTKIMKDILEENRNILNKL